MTIARIHKGEDWAAYVERAAFDAAPVAALDAVSKVLMGALRTAQERVEILERRLAEVESQVALADERIKAAESKPSLEYRGVWEAGRDYVRGNAVTDNGSIWILNKAAHSLARPGTSEGVAAWTLACKRGKDGKDAQ